MEQFPHYGALPPGLESAVTIGNFDGVHRGHQALIARAVSGSNGATVTALTFDPHPVQLLAPDLAPPLITPRREKYRLLGEHGVQVVLAQRFDREFAALSPSAFVERVLVDALGARLVVVGYDFTFGAKRAGKTQHLVELGQRHGFSVDIVSPQEVGEGLVASSSKVREFVLEGRMEGAALVLGRPFTIWGPVVQGRQRGRTIGFPTANVESETELLPKVGVYAARLDWGQGPAPAVVNVGFNPTFGESAARPTVEAHVLDADVQLYGQRVALQLVQRLRDEQRFPDVESLKSAIQADCAAAREALR